MPTLVDKYSREELENFVQKAHSYKEVLRLLGYSSCNGNSYKTIQKRVEEYGIDTSHFQERHSI